MNLKPSALVLLAALPTLRAQPAFEAASMRPSTVLANGRYGNYRMTGGPGTNDPSRMILENFDIRSLITQAYDIPMYRFSGPEWLFDIAPSAFKSLLLSFSLKMRFLYPLLRSLLLAIYARRSPVRRKDLLYKK